MTKIVCERRDCENWLEGECSKKEITVKEHTTSEEELAVCTTYKMVAAFC